MLATSLRGSQNRLCDRCIESIRTHDEDKGGSAIKEDNDPQFRTGVNMAVLSTTGRMLSELA
jgi:hypothetical protein